MYEHVKGLILSCFSTPLNELWAGAESRLKPLLDSGALVATEGPLDLGRVRFGDVQRSGAIPSICVLYSPRSAPDTTVMLTSNSDGWYTLVNVLSTSTSGRNLMVRSILDDEELHDFTVWSGGKEVRTVIVNQDPRWTFFEKGPALEFEETARYRKRLKRERLDRALLLRYLTALGWDVGDPRFWETTLEARYIEQRFRRS